MRVAPLLLPFALASSAAAASTLIVEVTGLSARPMSAPASEPSPARAEAVALLEQRCALCHGVSGRADGIMSPSLEPRPRDLSDPAWQRSVTDEQIAKVILHGGPALGKSPIMPANPDLQKKPQVVEEMVRLLRGFERRGVVRASLVSVDEETAAIRASAEALPDATGKRASLHFPRVPPGAVVLRGYFDADEDGKRGSEEPGFEKRVDVPEEDARVTVDLGASASSKSIKSINSTSAPNSAPGAP